ncbi:leucine-rich_repeat domain-containing protein [Hexamita inflata]|uniref:Leucine-rich repeat domain-containing protein n=1 Tax=Hexamita inflata TaxID=28002 RepID=A0AA86TYJ5_9EUKA|nr:leucine-rich repeat domain-containing protein [Hexamita inflata]
MQLDAQTDYLHLKHQSLTKFADPNIIKLIAESCSVEQPFQCETIQHLELRNCRLSSTSDLILDQCVNLNINYSKIASIQIQAPLTELSVECNLFSNANFLKNLIQLTVLNLAWNLFTDISPIAHLKYLQDLNLSFNSDVNIEPLKYLKQLRKLNLSDCNIKSIAALTKLPNLQFMVVSGNFYMDYTMLQHMKQLTHLHASRNNIKDVTCLQHLSLVELNLSDNCEIAIHPLQFITSLTILSLRNCDLFEISALIPLKRLEELDIAGNQIIHISALKHLPLKTIDIEENFIQNFSVFKRTLFRICQRFKPFQRPSVCVNLQVQLETP